MTWSISDRVDLRSPQINPGDARRQKKTAAEILRRLRTHPGQILADEVGMGKTFVALAVAVSVLEATARAKPVVVMVPSSVGSKWPLEWKKMASGLGSGPPIRATESSVFSAAEFLKLLDDKPSERMHLIFLTHGALTSGLSDPLVRLAIVQRALRSPRLARQRKAFPRWADHVIQGLHTQRLDEDLVRDLLSSSPARWSDVIAARKGTARLDDPVPQAILDALPGLDLGRLRGILEDLPLRSSPNIDSRLPFVRSSLTTEVAVLWRAALRQLHLRMPLLILDEAHHTKNPYTRLAGLFANKFAEEASETLTRGELGGVFERMLFLTATPFQLGHNELIEVLERFNGVCWDDLDRSLYEKQLEDLRRALDTSQAAALRLDRSWGHLSTADLPPSDDSWWAHPERDGLSVRAQGVATHWVDACESAKRAERLLRPHVIRHVRADRLSRREILCGAALVNDDAEERRGLTVSQRAVLPFLLAARAQALVSMHGVRDHRQARAVFAEGLASSFEAYTKTRTSHDLDAEVDERTLSDLAPLPDEVAWYLNRISGALPDEDDEALREHPKMQATVARVVELWRKREKTLVFCFYVATGRALRRHIAKAIEREIVSMGAEKLGLRADDAVGVHAELDRFRERLFTINSPSRRYATAELRRCLRSSLSGEDLDAGVDRCLRFLRTYSFLVRYVDLARPSEHGMREAFAKPDASGRTFRQVVGDFGRFMADRESDERDLFFQALTEIDIGDIGVRDDEGEREQLIANVRLANGSVERQVRERLMIAFNTPFYPEVLIASSVMAEGVDLHLMCRHVVHHDLDWNPSVIEQRTGRLDRIGSKGEVAKLPVKVYLPFIEGAQDEKQFRVMRDRERWFNVVMGERLELDEWSTDRLAERVGLPAAAAAGVAMDLAIVR